MFFLPKNYYNNYNYKNFDKKLLNLNPGVIKSEDELRFPNLYRIDQMNKGQLVINEENELNQYKLFV